MKEAMRTTIRTKTGLLVLMLGILIGLTACGGPQYVPQAINEETDICVICRMAIKDDQYATQIITTDGQSLKFDDIGCMNTWKTENGTATIGAAFVRDYNTMQWIPYEKAYYAYDASYQTPMAYGIVSFEQEADAQSFIDAQGAGTLMTAEALAGHSWAVNHEHEHEHGHSHDHGDEHGDGNGHEHGHDAADEHTDEQADDHEGHSA